MNRPIKFFELILAVVSIAGVVLTQFLYLRDSVTRHEEQIGYMKEQINSTDRKFEKIEGQLNTILSKISDLRVEMKDKQDRPTQNK